jgi:Flp pilus assembly protein TadG
MKHLAPTSFVRKQRGAVIITAALFMLFLLGFIGIALDLGRAFVVRSELQSAVDSCALSAAQELDGTATALTRATSAGLTAGNLNRVEFQSTTWAGRGQLVDTEITYRDAAYLVTVTPANAKYAQCAHVQPNLPMWLMRSFSAFFGGGPFPVTQNIAARAVATRASAQTACPVPLALKPKAGFGAPNYGFVVGEWVNLIVAPGGATNGQVGWANLDGSNSASETVAELDGRCGTEVGDTLGTPGVQTTAADNWNYRFGIYKNAGDPSQPTQRPDFSGYAYTATNWPGVGGNPPSNAYNGPTPLTAPADAANFVTKRAAFASCADTGTRVTAGGPPGTLSCEGITGLSLNSFQKLAAPGNVPGGHRQYGTSRRLVVVPVVNGANGVIDFACMFMLQPLSIPMTDVQLEYRGNAGSAGSPCTTNGLAGGTAGPLVPVLVR